MEFLTIKRGVGIGLVVPISPVALKMGGTRGERIV
jgi:hypothetical protein